MHAERLRELEAAGVDHLGTSLLALLGGHKDHTIGGIGSVEGCCRRTGEHADALDIVGIHGRNGISRLAGTGKDTLGLVALQVVHGDTVNHVEHVVVTVERLGTTHHHAGRTSHARCTGRKLHTGHLTAQ